MKQVLYPIYHVLYETGWGRNKEAIVAADSKERIPIIVEKHAREDIGISESSRKAKDIGFSVLGFLDTGFRANKEGIIGYSSKELNNRIKFKGKTLVLALAPIHCLVERACAI